MLKHFGLLTIIATFAFAFNFDNTSYAQKDLGDVTVQHSCPPDDEGRHPCPSPKPTKTPKPSKDIDLGDVTPQHSCPPDDEGRHPCPSPKPTKTPKPSN